MTPPQHHTVISAAAEEKKKGNPFERRVEWGQAEPRLTPYGSTGRGPRQKGCSATFLGSPSAAPATPSSLCPSSGGALTCFLPWQE